MRDGRKNILHEVLINVAVFLTSMLVICILIEVVVRVVIPQTLEKTVPGLYESSDELGYKMTPSYDQPYSRVEYTSRLTTNSYGFRDREYDIETDRPAVVMVLGENAE